MVVVVLKVSVGIGQPKTWFSGRSKLTSPQLPSAGCTLKEKPGWAVQLFCGLGVRLGHHPVRTAW